MIYNLIGGNFMFKVVKDRCIGCGACVGTCNEVYDFDDDGQA